VINVQVLAPREVPLGGPRAMTVRVVSAPPEMNRPVSCMIVSASSGNPSMVALAHTATRSLPCSTGHPRRSSAMPCRSVLNSTMACNIPIRAVSSLTTAS